MMDEIIRQLKKDEGRVIENGLHVPYEDHLGFETIGYGTLIDPKKGGGLDEEEAEFLLKNRLKKLHLELSQNDWFVEISPTRQAAIMMMAYQLGVSGVLGFKKMIAAIEVQNWDLVFLEALDSKWNTQTPGRAERIAKQLVTGEWQSN